MPLKPAHLRLQAQSIILIILKANQNMMLKDRSILVTEGAGFIGSHLVDRLLSGNEVIVLDNFSSGRKENLVLHRENPDSSSWMPTCWTPTSSSGLSRDIVFHMEANPDVKLAHPDCEEALFG